MYNVWYSYEHGETDRQMGVCNNASIDKVGKTDRKTDRDTRMHAHGHTYTHTFQKHKHPYLTKHVHIQTTCPNVNIAVLHN